MQVCFGTMLAGALLFGVFEGRGDAVFAALLQGAGAAVERALGLMGSFGIFCGLMNVLSQAGGVEGLKRLLKRPLRFLLGEVEEEALSYVTLNMAANMLGLGNAATPAGLKAAALLSDGPRAGAALSMFLVINTSSVQLLPSTVIALRTAHGAAHPEAVILPGLAATALSTVVGILCCKGMEKRR